MPSSRTSAPTRLHLHRRDLAEFARFFAREVAGGAYPYVDFDPDERWHQRLYRDRRMDVWLISWLPTQGTQLHDHGGSSGSFTVLSGTLTEARLAGGSLHDVERPAGAQATFGPRYVHDVRNTSTAPAVSVHVYSPPLSSMNFYDLSDGALSRIATLATDDPEPDFPAAPTPLAAGGPARAASTRVTPARVTSARASSARATPVRAVPVMAGSGPAQVACAS